jgi:deferrochelatase/peroxidase EfeB
MRKNKFGETYVHSAKELLEFFPEGEDNVYLSFVSGPEGDEKATGEVATNADGDIVCYIEADTEDDVMSIAREAGIEMV